MRCLPEGQNDGPCALTLLSAATAFGTMQSTRSSCLMIPSRAVIIRHAELSLRTFPLQRGTKPPKSAASSLLWSRCAQTSISSRLLTPAFPPPACPAHTFSSFAPTPNPPGSVEFSRRLMSVPGPPDLPPGSSFLTPRSSPRASVSSSVKRGYGSAQPHRAGLRIGMRRYVRPIAAPGRRVEVAVASLHALSTSNSLRFCTHLLPAPAQGECDRARRPSASLPP